jgi:polyhydroxyalkanoate synthesis repressor PhaR
MAVIKRYANRKLYDTEAKHYVTLNDIAGQIRAGGDVQVIDHETGADITSLISAQVILAQEKKAGGFLPKDILNDLLHAGSDTLQQLRLALTAHSDLDAQVNGAIERRLRKLVKQGELEAEEARVLLAKLQSVKEPVKVAPERNGRAARARQHPVPTRQQIARLTRRVADLNAQLDELVAAAKQKP